MFPMITIRRFGSVASIVACLASVTLGPAAVAFAATDGAPGADAGARPHGRHERGDLVRASLRLESLSPGQRQQIEALVQRERTAHANVAAARSQLMKAVAAGVAAGSVSNASLAPSVQAVEGAIAADEPGDRATLEKLHAILTPAQRVELVTKIEAREQHFAGRHADAGNAPRVERGERGIGMLGRALDLSDAQKQQIGANLRSMSPTVDKSVWKEAREARQHVLEAFQGDRFLMSEVAPPRDPRLVDQGIERIVRVAEASAPVLTPEQRATASAKLQEMAARGRK
jgi:Spy/CpxP family protein refolding chaperone